MALFDENTTIEPAPRPRMSRRTLAGVWALAVAMVVLLVITFLPTSYVIQRPGPVYNTLGTAQNADGEEVPLISVEGAETYPTDGSLDLLTVQVQGNREHTPSWFELAMAWFDPSRAVMPIDTIFPEDQTTEQRNEESAQMMVDSQHEATAAALTELGYDVGGTLSVYSVIDGAAAEGILEQGDLILEANGEELTDVSTLRSVINEGEGAPVELLIERDGEQQTVEVTPKETTDDAGKTTWILGVNLTTDYDFPIDVTIQLNNVGGPSAGMMFALGIIDTLTPGELNGGQQVAGTGTITADGEVGPIGGIHQKMWGALDAGAQWFLAPEANCDEVVGHIPGDLRVFSVEDLDDALAVLDAVSSDGDLDALPTCTLK
ncbi:ATP-dependent serine peptidase containing a PDZ domain protein [Microbacterium sp. Leaf288]|uniref:YlbL family protein n=1 Tax=Microbacterium sp. Leaf288 TaxID=1736323 RepID=UPI0006F82CD8|nr:S16 family serine protease [Microbacterium sp. Leaf288]KQP71670.1 ATP-dependent serine peptidase containing a PDZ domain protein [Microbacterium sp. Leaf288]